MNEMSDVDHRVLGNRMHLFHQQDEGPGMVFWHPRGWELYRVIEDSIRARMRRAGFQEIRTPQLLARSLWEKSGHWEKFGQNMFSTVDAEGGRPFCLKPMSCPCHIQVFNKRVRSWHDLPLRFSEFGACHRDEPSGGLQGLMRTRSFVQDDAHVFCLEEHIEAEVVRFTALLREVYTDFGFPKFQAAFSTRPAVRGGSEHMWDRAEALLENASRAAQLDCHLQPGEGAFYGPKLEFHLRDSRGRNWQCGTIQLDMLLPERLGATYIDRDSQRAVPVMLHHAVLGSLERFIGMLLEHHEGWLPTWLAPEQVTVATVSDSSIPYAKRVAIALEQIGVRVKLDARSERLPRKIVDAREQCIPFFVAVGNRDERDQTLVLRERHGSQRTMSLEEAIAVLEATCKAPDTGPHSEEPREPWVNAP
ncbi:MAG: threonine--tRNA ligase [Alcaligenaceae bacterium]|nr:MAG: threonine--tRNA ligase [Alcaligenaceae bacterium]